ncbi:preprotein translocase subunit YajC [Clostridiaceae bacterium M8S5]|nr:preprotein translocase subunit YajC [Clostridiaceae bacterium M8S5]
MQGLQTLLIPVLFLGVLYFLLIRPQKKREKNIRAMRDAMKIGDDIITIGGIYGKVTKIKDDSVVIEVGADKVKMTVTKWSIGSVVNQDTLKETK